MKKISEMTYDELYSEFKIAFDFQYINNIITNPEVLKEFYDQLGKMENAITPEGEINPEKSRICRTIFEKIFP